MKISLSLSTLMILIKMKDITITMLRMISKAKKTKYHRHYYLYFYLSSRRVCIDKFSIFDWIELKYFFARDLSPSSMELTSPRQHEHQNSTEAVSDVVEWLFLHLVYAFVVSLMCIPLATFAKEGFLCVLSYSLSITWELTMKFGHGVTF